MNSLNLACRNKRGILLIVLALLSGSAVVAYSKLNLPQLWQHSSTGPSDISEGPVTSATITAGPFDIRRKYRSMEGPYMAVHFKVGDLIESRNIACPEGMVCFSENGGAPKMNGGTNADKAGMSALEDPSKTQRVQGLKSADPKPSLWWFKGVKLDVLDENDKVLPNAEFICHWNLDIACDYRTKIFPEGHKCLNPRLVSISQGETEVFFPQGFGVPCASPEKWDVFFQAANRSDINHRRVKHRATFYFIKDSELVTPLQALYWFVPYQTVVVDHNIPDLNAEQRAGCNMCIGTTYGVDAPNDVAGGVWADGKGRRLSGHWVVPPGTHTYHDVIGDRDAGFADPQDDPILQAAWTHVHPFATRMSLVEVKRTTRTVVYSSVCHTQLNPTLITHIDFLNSKSGIRLHPDAGTHYEMEVTYNNPLSEPIDSMASMGFYFRDAKFSRPDWARPEFDGKFCGLTPDGQCQKEGLANTLQEKLAEAGADKKTSNGRAIDEKQLGPLLTGPIEVEVGTSAGPIDLELDPRVAPKTATYMYHLLAGGAMNGTKIFCYEPGFIIGFARPDDKQPEQPAMSQSQARLVHRVPLEIAKGAKHDEYLLSMGRDENARDSATGSFFIMLGKAPHLDSKYCVFGRVVRNQQSLATINAIKDHWQQGRFFIAAARRI